MKLTRSESIAQYLEGFKTKCSEFGIDPAQAYVDMILKEAQTVPKPGETTTVPPPPTPKPPVNETVEQRRQRMATLRQQTLSKLQAEQAKNKTNVTGRLQNAASGTVGYGTGSVPLDYKGPSSWIPGKNVFRMFSNPATALAAPLVYWNDVTGGMFNPFKKSPVRDTLYGGSYAKTLGAAANNVLQSPIPAINWLGEFGATALGKKWTPYQQDMFSDIGPTKEEEGAQVQPTNPVVSEARAQQLAQNTDITPNGGYAAGFNYMEPVARQVNLNAISPYRYTPRTAKP